MKTDTPRTDIMVTGNSDPTQDEYEDLAAFARQLERECTALREAVKPATEELLAALNEIRDMAEQARAFATPADAKLIAAIEAKLCAAIAKHQGRA